MSAAEKAQESEQSAQPVKQKNSLRIVASPTLSNYRGYMLRQNKQKDIFTCAYLFKHSNYHMPRRFVWYSSSQYHELQQFIDALCNRRVLEVKKFEELSMATEIGYETPPSDVPIITISPVRLLAILRGEDVLEVPATTKLRFLKSHSQHYPVEFFAELADEKTLGPYLEAVQKRVDEGRPIFCFGEVPAFVNPDYSRIIPADVQLQQAETTMGTPINTQERYSGSSRAEEVVINEVSYTGYIETISLVTKRDSEPYYTRRLRNKKGDIVWCGTSYNPAGPWTIYSQDKTRLDALGVPDVHR